MLLAIDTATQSLSLALHDGETLRAEQTWYSPNMHTVQLAPAIRQMLERADLTVEALTALAVSIGPGSYTGLRIGVALAKGLAAARGLPLVGVPTLDIVAAAQPHFQGGMIAVAQAGRGRIIAGTYQWRKGHWKARGEAQLMDWATLIASIDGAALITGEIDDMGRAALAEAAANELTVTVAQPVYRLRRAGFLAEDAWARLREPDANFTAANVTPLYVKTKDIPT